MTAFSSLSSLAAQLRTGKLSPVELVRACLSRIERYDATLNSFLAVFADAALEEAGHSERRFASGAVLGPLDGIPIALKDLIDVAGSPTTAGLAVPWRPRADADAFLVRRLRGQGAVLLGKLNLHEAAMGATNDNPHYGKARNPWNPGHTPGGSSGGSGAAVAAGLCPAALGSDTMGSVRIPAAYCGVSGLVPTYGRVSLNGVAPLCWSMDTVGPLAGSVGDLALVMDAISGFDPDYPHGRRPPADLPLLAPIAPAEPASIKLGVIENWGDGEEVEPAVAAAFGQALGAFGEMGCEIREYRVEEIGKARRHGLIVIEGDAALVHARMLAEQPERLGDDVRAQIEYGARMAAGKLARAHAYRDRLRHRFAAILEEVDVVTSPATPQAPFAFGTKVPSNQALFSAPANLCGLPALSLPMGFDAAGLPLGLQLIGAPWREARLLQVGQAYQERTDWHTRRPPGFG